MTSKIHAAALLSWLLMTTVSVGANAQVAANNVLPAPAPPVFQCAAWVNGPIDNLDGTFSYVAMSNWNNSGPNTLPAGIPIPGGTNSYTPTLAIPGLTAIVQSNAMNLSNLSAQAYSVAHYNCLLFPALPLI
jgi:hypothetical protein